MDGLNHYNYCRSNPVNYTDPTGLIVVRNNRQLGGNEDKGKYNPFTHTYLYTAINGVLTGTYSWGNSYTEEKIGNWHLNASNDVDAAKKSIENETGVVLTKDNKLDPYIEKAMDELQKTDNKTKHKWGLTNNCKTDTSRLLAKALELYKKDTGKDYEGLTKKGEKYQKDFEKKKNELTTKKVKEQAEKDTQGDTSSQNPNNQLPQPPLTSNNNNSGNTSNNTNDNGGSGGSNTDSGSDDSGSGSVICTELFRQGLLDIITYNADAKFGEHIRIKYPYVMKGYHFIAIPIVNKMKTSQGFTNFIYKFAKPWAEEMSYQMNIAEKGNFTGKVIMNIGMKICYMVGFFITYPFLFYIFILMLLFILGFYIFRKKVFYLTKMRAKHE